MDREMALKQFQEEQYPILKQCGDDCIRKFQQNAEELAANVRKAFSMLPDKEFAYFYFSLLRCDLTKRKYTILFQAQDERWFLDPEPAEWSFQADFVFEGFHEVWDQLLDRQKYYVGKLNTYDVDTMVREAIMECCLMVGDLLRFYFRDIEEMPEFIAAKKQAVWQIYWGEYRGESVLVAQADREPKTESQWLQAIRDDKDGSELKESYWYQAELSQGDCEKKDLSFAIFEDCRLKNLVFKGAVLVGARFKNCRIEDCDFEGADCHMAYFEHCTWAGPKLKGTNLKGVAFTEDGIPAEWLEEAQVAEALIKEEV